jgi:hypothetical protein
MTTKDHAKLLKKIEQHLLDLGAVPTPDRMYHYSLMTALGELAITIAPIHTGPYRSELVTIFTRFDQPALAVKRFPHEVNSYSGKWNFHFDKKSCTAESVFACFEADLAKTFDDKARAIAAAGLVADLPVAS